MSIIGRGWGTNPGPHNDLDEVPGFDDRVAEVEREAIENGRRRLDQAKRRGTSWWLLLNQTEWWSAEAGQIRLDDMTDGHRVNLRDWLDARAPQIAQAAGWYWVHELNQPHGDMALEALEQIADEEWDEQIADPTGWLHRTPLYARLVELIVADHVDVTLPVPTLAAPAPRPLPVEVQ